MKKRIPGYVPIGDGTQFRGEKNTDFYFSKEGIEIREVGAFGIAKSKEFISVNDIVEADCFRGSEIQNDSAANALAGGLLFGVPGAIIGGILGQNKKSWYCKFRLNDDRVIFFRLALEQNQSYITKWINSSSIEIKHTI